MSPKLRRLSGDDVIRILSTFGFQVLSQRGSHVKLRRLAHGSKQTLTIPRHRELDAGTLSAIFSHASKYISAEDLRPHFYSD